MLPRYKVRAWFALLRRLAKEKRIKSSLPQRISPLALYILPPKGKLVNAPVYAPYPLKCFYDVYSRAQDYKNFRNHWRENPFFNALQVFTALRHQRQDKNIYYNYMKRYKPLFYNLTYITHPIIYSNFVIDMTFYTYSSCNRLNIDANKIIRRFLHLAPNNARVWVVNDYQGSRFWQILEGYGFHWSNKGYYVKKIKRSITMTIRRL